jgi:hypothetical protein
MHTKFKWGESKYETNVERFKSENMLFMWFFKEIGNGDENWIILA